MIVVEALVVTVLCTLLLPSFVYGEAQTDFSIKPNGKLSHTEANLVR